MCNEMMPLTVDTLAAEMYQSKTGFMEDMPTFAALADMTKLGWRQAAKFMLSRYAILPLDSAASCSGCRTLTDALNNLDEARHEVVALRGTRAASAQPALDLCSCSGTNKACCSKTEHGPCSCSSGPHVGLEMDAHYTTEQICKVSGQSITPDLFNGIRAALLTVLKVSEERRQIVQKFRRSVVLLADVTTEEEVQRVFPAAMAEAQEREEGGPVVDLLQLVINTKGV